MRFAHMWVAAIFLLLAFSACTAGQSAPTVTPLPDAQTLLNKAALEVQNAKSIKIKLQLTGAPSYVNPPTNSIAFISANGLYVAPDRFSATVSASILGVPGSVDVVAIGDDQWMKNQILTAGHWISAIFSPGFNAGKLISSSQGIQFALKAFKNIKIVGVENIDGQDMIHISGTADGADIASLTVGLIRGKIVNVDLYIPIDTGRVDRVIMVQPDTVTDKEPNPTTWTLELFDYNAEATIAAPQVSTVPASGPGALPTLAQIVPQPATEQATQAQ